MSNRFRILIRSAAGPRIGYGHLVRARTLSRALDADVRVSVRGGASATTCARRMGLSLAPRGMRQALAAVRPSLVVIDDPSTVAARAAVAAVRAAGLPVASIHDLGLAPVASDLAIDGTIAPMQAARGRCVGPRFALLDPALAKGGPARGASRTDRPRVLVALGGGPRVRLAAQVARAVWTRLPGARIRVAAGLQHAPRESAGDPRITWLGPLPTLARELRACDVAVVAGGVTLYEACALGVATVAVPVVAAQRRTVEGFAARGAILAAPLPRGTRRESTRLVAEHVARLSSQPGVARRQSRVASAIVDGVGAARVAEALTRLAGRGTAGPRRYAGGGGATCAR